MANAPQSAFRSFLGVAKDTVNAQLTSGIAAAAVSLPLTNTVGTTGTLTSAGATYSAVIVDGPLTETVACSGNLTTGAIACAATTNPHAANVYVYFQLTASIGPTAFIRYKKIDLSDMYAQLYDTGARGSQALNFGAQQGMRVGNWSLEGDLFADEFGYIAAMFFGAYDYTATSGSAPTTYAFSPQNAGTGQPTPYLLYDYNPGANTCYVMAKIVASDLTVKFDPGALIGWTVSGKGFAMGPVATPTQTYSTFSPVASLKGITTISGTINQDVKTAEYAFKRGEYGEINTLQGIQDPLAIFGGPVTLNTKISGVQADTSQYLNYVNISQPTFDITALKGLTTARNGIEIHCNAANYEALKFDQTGQAYVGQDWSFEALANTTDATTAGTGFSVAKVTVSVATNTGATQY